MMLIILFGIMEYGWMLTKAAQLNNAARDGARVGAREGATAGDISAAVTSRLAEANINGATVNITPGAIPGDTVTVEVTVAYVGGLELTGYLPDYVLPEQLRSQVTMRKEGP
ncbi:MAG: pilus assembly protein [Phycisphaeraceae bacterium]|nr:pilus assembly protein [Phycisphaeraceae bacterium]